MPGGGSRTLINGREGGLIDARDRGLAYGDGLFETIAVIKGSPSLWQGHMARLSAGCDRLGLPLPETGLLLAEIRQLAGLGTGVAKLILTRGIGRRGYGVPQPLAPTRIVQFHIDESLPPPADAPAIRAILCKTPLGLNPSLAGLKHLNRLEQVMARREWDDPAIAEGIMSDCGGSVIEGVSSNLFLMRSGRLLTPALDRCGVAGVMRACVIEAAAGLGIHLEETAISKKDLFAADGVFLTNALWGIRRVEYLGETRFDLSRLDPRLMNAVWRKAFGSDA